MWGKGVVRAAVPMPPYTGSLLGQAVWLGCDYRGTQDSPLGKMQDLSCNGGQDKRITCAHVPFLWGIRSRPGPHHAQNGEEDDDGQAGICAVGAGVDIWVPLLVELQHAEASNHVHE